MTGPQSSNCPAVGLVSLGCPKALVDSEAIVSRLRAEGYRIAPNYEEADVVVVNTCGFIDEAKTESLQAIGEALQANGRVLVTGCMGARPEDITRIHPRVLNVTGPQQAEAVMQSIHRHMPRPHDPRLDLVPPGGLKLTPPHYAYLKISEGCNNRCTFCIIPSMRGRLASRPLGLVLREAEQLVARGVRELMVISQDTSAYGVDLRYQTDYWQDRAVETRLYDLARELGQLDAWIRLHYVYPYPHVDRLVELMADGHILPYLDVPFQHASPRILKRMRRPAASDDTLARIHRWRKTCPELIIRSTFIVGFPGETDADFEYLLNWLEQAQLDRVGCFRYSPVDGAAANELPEPVAPDVAETRWQRFMQHQAAISNRRLQARIGRRERVLVDQVEHNRAVARSYADAPEVDGQVFVDGIENARSGDWLDVRITDASGHDLHARPVRASELNEPVSI
ncbi:MAG: 30S ribosomal protein S12 methylthiotransferase RimO [Pseudomonadota bacterium]|nr:MAG: 30S ribosomal protein S12 methylthiotransferase RimO [Pseudomonadota bacterium]